MMGRKNKKNKPKPAPVSVTPQSSVLASVAKPAVESPAPADPGNAFVNIGRSIHIKGELSGNEDLTIDGKVEGVIRLRDHNLTISENGHITADVFAKSAVIHGEVLGDIRAEDRIEIAEGGLVEGDLIAPKVVLADGARFKGRIDMLSGCDAQAGDSKQVWGEPAEASAFDETPADFVDDVIDEIIENAPAAKEPADKKKSNKGKQDKKAEKSGEEEPKLSEMFEEFDPANP
ncbi:MAG: bactofilin family protein [Planctomycetota bacterium]|jgi:cytoskeletal protein CcmA (bactofilin family)